MWSPEQHHAGSCMVSRLVSAQHTGTTEGTVNTIAFMTSPLSHMSSTGGVRSGLIWRHPQAQHLRPSQCGVSVGGGAASAVLASQGGVSSWCEERSGLFTSLHTRPRPQPAKRTGTASPQSAKHNFKHFGIITERHFWPTGRARKRAGASISPPLDQKREKARNAQFLAKSRRSRQFCSIRSMDDNRRHDNG
jgi:hypothetical protein